MKRCHAAIFENSNLYCFSMVARNQTCELVAAPELAEAIGIREALSWELGQDEDHATSC